MKKRSICFESKRENSSVKVSMEFSSVDEAAEVVWQFHNIPDPLMNRDVIIGLGSYDDSVAEESARLWSLGFGSAIIFSGNQGNWTSGNILGTEAMRFANIANEAGVPVSKIILEESATNIAENIIFSSQLMIGLGWQTAIIVTKPQTIRRTKLTVAKHYLPENVTVSCPNVPMAGMIDRFGRERIYSEIVGDLDRIIQYPSRGFHQKIEIPSAVLKAFECPKNCGFTSHLLPFE